MSGAFIDDRDFEIISKSEELLKILDEIKQTLEEIDKEIIGEEE